VGGGSIDVNTISHNNFFFLPSTTPYIATLLVAFAGAFLSSLAPFLLLFFENKTYPGSASPPSPAMPPSGLLGSKDAGAIEGQRLLRELTALNASASFPVVSQTLFNFVAGDPHAFSFSTAFTWCCETAPFSRSVSLTSLHAFFFAWLSSRCRYASSEVFSWSPPGTCC
jgi:hypothetical protein